LPAHTAARFGRDAAHAEWFYGFRLAAKTDLGSLPASRLPKTANMIARVAVLLCCTECNWSLSCRV
jgi:hypothetical protein